MTSSLKMPNMFPLPFLVGIAIMFCAVPRTSGYSHINHLHRAQLVRFTPLDAFRTSSNRFIPPLMEEKLKLGQVTSSDLERMFGLTETDVEVIQRPTTIGYAGVIFDLDTALVDLSTVVGYTLATFAAELDQPTPHPTQVKDVLGGSLRDMMLHLEWNVPMTESDLKGGKLALYEARFYHIMYRFMEAFPVTAVPGAGSLLNALLVDKNAVTVMTSLPRHLAVAALRKAQLSPLFEGRVDPDNLVTPLHLAPDLGANPSLTTMSTVAQQTTRATTATGATGATGASARSVVSVPPTVRDGATLLRCCGIMRKPAVLTTVISGNRRTVLSSKRLGLTTVAVQGYTTAVHELRMADKVLPPGISLVPLVQSGTCKEIYTLTLRALKQSQGPAIQTADVAAPIKTKTQAVATASGLEDRRPRDTFADEFGSDTM